jgi:hypothetical protein
LHYRRHDGYVETRGVDNSDARYPLSYHERYHALDDDGREPEAFLYFRRNLNWPPPTYGGWDSRPQTDYGSSSDNSGGHNSWNYQQTPQAPRSGYNDYTQQTNQPGKSMYQKLSAHVSRAKNFVSGYMPGTSGYQKLSGNLNSNYFFWTQAYKDKKKAKLADQRAKFTNPI